MSTFFLLWNSDEWPYSNILRLAESISETGNAEENWRFRAVRQVRLGDRVLLFKTGAHPKGVFGTGVVIGPPFRDLGSDGKDHSMVRVRFDEITDPFVELIISEEQAAKLPAFSPGQASGNGVLDASVEVALWDFIEKTSPIRSARRNASRIYSGASLAVHRHTPPSIADCIARIRNPVQRAAEMSKRDISLLSIIFAESDNGSFDPSSARIPADVGVLSRLASLGMIATDGLACFLTSDGLRAGAAALDSTATEISSEIMDNYSGNLDKIGHTERDAFAKQRIGQDVFRRGLIKYWDGRCCVTGISEVDLLRASHIVAWSKCKSDAERLDVCNGLLLAAHIDAAFDVGLITIDESATVCLSSRLSRGTAEKFGLGENIRITRLTSRHHENLDSHRKKFAPG